MGNQNLKGQTAQWPKSTNNDLQHNTQRKHKYCSCRFCIECLSSLFVFKYRYINIVHVDFVLSAFQTCLFLNTDTQINVRIHCSTGDIFNIQISTKISIFLKSYTMWLIRLLYLLEPLIVQCIVIFPLDYLSIFI